MQKCFQKWQFECLRQAELWKARMVAKQQEEKLSNSPPASSVEESAIANDDVKQQQKDFKHKRGRKTREQLQAEKSNTQIKDQKPYNLREKAKIEYKEKDCRRINQIEAVDKKIEGKMPVSKEEEVYLSHLKEYWETRSYETIELDPKLVGRFSNQTKEARWHLSLIHI